MTKTARLITENLKLVDLVVEIADARIPCASRNPYLAELVGTKPRILILNKSDMADPAANTLWVKAFAAQGIRALLTDSRGGKVYSALTNAVRSCMQEELQRRAAKGMQGKPLRLMITGVPNVGKSTFINNLSGKAVAKTGDRPGVTTGKQWITIPGGFELLDTPGMLWQKFEDETIGMHLAFTGAVKDTVVDTEELAMHLLIFLRGRYAPQLCARYKLENINDMDGYELLCAIAKKRGFLIGGGEYDTERVANIVLDEYRAAKIGRITFEWPQQK